MAVRRELVFDECGGAPRRRRQAHAFLIDRPTKFIKKRENASAAKTDFALTRLQSPVFTAARFYHIFSFPLPPRFSFSGGHCGTVPRASQRPKNCRVKLLYALFATVPRRSCFFILSVLVKAYVCTNFSFFR